MDKKKTLSPGTLLNPVPVVLVSSAHDGEKNLITIAWTGIVNSEPPMTYISVRKSRHSHELIEESGCFVINLVTEDLARAVDWCGVKSGRDVDKFKECGLTALPADKVDAPLVAESPVNLECKIVEKHDYPSHDMFVAEIVAVHCDEDLLDKSGRLRLDKAGLVAYNHGEYFGLKGEAIGKFGFSVMKPRTAKRIEKEKRAASRTASRSGKSAKSGSGSGSASRMRRQKTK